MRIRARLVGLLATFLLLGILIGLPGITWMIFAVWLLVVLTFYFAYGRRHAVLNTYVDPEEIAEPRGDEED